MEFFHISYLQHEKEIIIADLKLGEFLQPKSILYHISLGHSFTGSSVFAKTELLFYELFEANFIITRKWPHIF